MSHPSYYYLQLLSLLLPILLSFILLPSSETQSRVFIEINFVEENRTSRPEYLLKTIQIPQRITFVILFCVEVM